MEIDLSFNYKGFKTIIFCNASQKWKEVFDKYCNIVKIDINSVYFSYQGKEINEDLNIDLILNEVNKEIKNIDVHEKIIKDSNKEIIEPKDIICPTCGENALINIIDYKILFKCQNCSNNYEFLYKYKEIIKKDMPHIICDKCSSKDNIYNPFFYCISCKFNLCSKCKDNHDKNHDILNYEDKNYKCNTHNSIYISYCETCKKNLCLFCIKNHDKHALINFGNILPDIKQANINIIELKNKIESFNTIIDKLINKLLKVKESINSFYEINEKILNCLNNNKINYEVLFNYNIIHENENKILNDINNILKNININERLKYINEIYQKIKTKSINEITIIYDINKNKGYKYMNIFGPSFVERNKNNCKMIIEGKEYELNNIINLKQLENENNYLEIKLKGVQNITDLSDMFWKCSSLISLPDLSELYTINITNTSDMFRLCTSLKSLPDISKWNTSNIKDTSFMFFGCSSLESLPDISKWDTSNVKDMSGMFYGCKSLISLPNISKWKISKNVNTHGMFFECNNLIKIPKKFS